MGDKFDVFKDRIVNAKTSEKVKNLIRQFERSRADGDISKNEEENLKDIAHRKLESDEDDSPD